MATTERQVHAEKEIGTDTARGTESGLDENVVGALSYVFGFVSGLIVYLLERDNPFARFHAAQSIALTGTFAVLYIALSVFGTTVTAIYVHQYERVHRRQSRLAGDRAGLARHYARRVRPLGLPDRPDLPGQHSPCAGRGEYRRQAGVNSATLFPR